MISPLAYVDPSAKLGQNVTVHPFAYIDADVEIGDNCEIMPYVSIISGTRMGSGNKIYNGSIIGANPQDFRWKGEKSYCIIGNDNTIREKVLINRSIREGEATVIGNGTFIMADSHIGHDANIADHCVIGNRATLAGNTTVGECSILSSGVILHEGSRLGPWTLIKGGCRISGNVPPYVIMAHNPAVYFGVNAVVLRKGRFTDEEIDDVAKVYRHIYQSGTSVFNAPKRIEADVPQSKVRDAIIDFVRGSNLKIVAIPREFE